MDSLSLDEAWLVPLSRIEKLLKILVDNARCPFCNGYLRSATARQCPECLRDWHDPDNVIVLERMSVGEELRDHGASSETAAGSRHIVKQSGLFKRPADNALFRRGFSQLVVGLLLYAAIWFYVFRQGGFGDSRGGTFYIVFMGVPGALALSGLLEIVTGRSFTDLAASWDQLQPRQRGIYGVITVIVAATLVFGSLLLIGWLTHA